MFNYRYSSRVGDGGWFGLHKVSNYAQYILVSYPHLCFRSMFICHVLSLASFSEREWLVVHKTNGSFRPNIYTYIRHDLHNYSTGYTMLIGLLGLI